VTFFSHNKEKLSC